jgi:hypothetical protein
MEKNIFLTLRSFWLVSFLFYIKRSMWRCWIQAGGQYNHGVVDSRIENNLRIDELATENCHKKWKLPFYLPPAHTAYSLFMLNMVSSRWNS